MTTRQLIIEGRTDDALKRMLNMCWKDSDVKITVEALATRYNNLRKSNHLGVITAEESSVELNKIHQSMLAIISESRFKFCLINQVHLFWIVSLIFVALFTSYKVVISQRGNSIFIVEELRRFKNDTDNKLAMNMIDNNKIRLDIFPDDDEDDTLFIRSSLISRVFVLEDLNSSAEYRRIQKIFDHFFEEVGYFHRYIEDGTINRDDIQEIIYYLDILFLKSNSRKPIYLKNAIREYVSHYRDGFPDFFKLCNKLGYDLENNYK